MASIEELIAAQRAQAASSLEANKLALNQEMEAGLTDIQTEEAEINPMYDKAIGDANKLYSQNLGATRSSAAGRGAYWGSGGLTNQELSLAQSHQEQVGAYQGERTRKLADISRRRSLIKKQTQEKATSLERGTNADLESTLAKLRYDDFTRQEDLAMERWKEQQANARAASSASSANMPQWMYEENKDKDIRAIIGEMRAENKGWGDIADTLDEIYGAGTARQYDRTLWDLFNPGGWGQTTDREWDSKSK